eukprot:Nk52_evm64s485 gene=Nk52_evmTU64s485
MFKEICPEPSSADATTTTSPSSSAVADASNGADDNLHGPDVNSYSFEEQISTSPEIHSSLPVLSSANTTSALKYEASSSSTFLPSDSPYVNNESTDKISLQATQILDKKDAEKLGTRDPESTQLHYDKKHPLHHSSPTIERKTSSRAGSVSSSPICWSNSALSKDHSTRPFPSGTNAFDFFSGSTPTSRTCSPRSSVSRSPFAPRLSSGSLGSYSSSKKRVPSCVPVLRYAFDVNIMQEERDFVEVQQFLEGGQSCQGIEGNIANTLSSCSDEISSCAKNLVLLSDNWNVINIEEFWGDKNALVLKHILCSGCRLEELVNIFKFMNKGSELFGPSSEFSVPCIGVSLDAIDGLDKGTPFPLEGAGKAKNIKVQFVSGEEDAVQLQFYRARGQSGVNHDSIFEKVLLCCMYPALTNEMISEKALIERGKVLKDHFRKILRVGETFFEDKVVECTQRIGSHNGKVLLMQDLETHFEHIENNSLPNYDPDSFETRQDYCLFHLKERERVKTLINSFYSMPFHADLKYKRGRSKNDDEQSEGCLEILEDLTQRGLEYSFSSTLNQSGAMDELTGNIVNEFCLRYGISPIMQNLVLLDHLVLQCELLDVQKCSSENAEKVLSSLASLCDVICNQSEKLLLSMRDKTYLERVLGGVLMLLKAKFMSLANFHELTKDQIKADITVFVQILNYYCVIECFQKGNIGMSDEMKEDLLLDLFFDCVKMCYVKFSSAQRPSVTLEGDVEVKGPIRSWLLLHQARFIRMKTHWFTERYAEAFKEFLDVESSVIVTFAECLSEDIAEYCRISSADLKQIDQYLFLCMLEVEQICCEWPSLKAHIALPFFWKYFYGVVAKWIASLCSSVISLLLSSSKVSGEMFYSPTIVNMPLYLTDTHLKNKIMSLIEKGNVYVVPNSRPFWDLLLGVSLFCHFFFSFTFLSGIGKPSDLLYDNATTVSEYMHSKHMDLANQASDCLCEVFRLFNAKLMAAECETLDDSELGAVANASYLSSKSDGLLAMPTTDWVRFVFKLKEMIPIKNQASCSFGQFKFRSKTLKFYCISVGDYTRANDIEAVCLHVIPTVKERFYKTLKSTDGLCACGSRNCTVYTACSVFKTCFSEMDSVENEMIACWGFQIEKLALRLSAVVESSVEICVSDKNSKCDFQQSLKPLFAVFNKYNFSLEQRLYPLSYEYLCLALWARIIRVFRAQAKGKKMNFDTAYCLLVCFDTMRLFFSGLWSRLTLPYVESTTAFLELHTLSTKSLVKVVSIGDHHATLIPADDDLIDEICQSSLEMCLSSEKRHAGLNGPVLRIMRLLHASTNLIKVKQHGYDSCTFSGKALNDALYASVAGSKRHAADFSRELIDSGLLHCVSDPSLEGSVICDRSIYKFALDDSDGRRILEEEENPLLEHLGLSTTISGVKKGTNTRSSESWGLNKLNRVAVSNGDRCLLNGFKIISQMADRIALSQLIVQRAQKIFAHENVQKYIRGKATEGMCAACLYLACRWEKTPRTFKEIMNVTSVPQKTVRKNYKKLISMVDMANVQTISTDDFMARFCSNLKLPMVVQALAAKVATNAFNSDCVSGKSPISIAAAAIYLVTMATDEKRAAKDIATVSGVSESTIKLCFKEMFPKRYKLFPRESFCYDKLDLMKA